MDGKTFGARAGVASCISLVCIALWNAACGVAADKGASTVNKPSTVAGGGTVPVTTDGNNGNGGNDPQGNQTPLADGSAPVDNAGSATTATPPAEPEEVPDGVPCDDNVCLGDGEVCCIPLLGGRHCESESCGFGERTQSCDGPEDCPGPAVCCGDTSKTTCRDSCKNGEIILCHSDEECPDGKRCAESAFAKGLFRCDR